MRRTRLSECRMRWEMLRMMLMRRGRMWNVQSSCLISCMMITMMMRMMVTMMMIKRGLSECAK